MAKTKRPENLEEAAILAKMLRHPERMRMVAILAFDGAASVSELVSALRLPQPIVSRHLGHLRMARMVETRRAGKQIFYSIHRNLPRSSGFRDLKALLAKLGE